MIEDTVARETIGSQRSETASSPPKKNTHTHKNHQEIKIKRGRSSIKTGFQFSNTFMGVEGRVAVFDNGIANPGVA